MDDLGCLLEEVEAKGDWSKEDVEKYFALSEGEEKTEYGGGCSYKIRDYKFGDDVDDLIDRVGEYSLEELEEEGYRIQVLEENGKIYGVIATRSEEGAQYIGAIAVDGNVEGRGNMGGLIDAINDERPMTAKVSSSNLHARGAFEKYGFRSEGSFNGWVNMVRR